ncbi:MAG: endonuclease/exonuclease/phosphatase family protein [Bacteroidia bacterium]
MKTKIYFFTFLLLIFIFQNNPCFSQEKKYKIGLIGFYNLENLFDTIDGPNNDAEFLPDGANLYTGKVYLDKLSKLADVISLIGTDASPDGLSIMGCAEVENKSVLTDLTHQPKLAARHYEIVHYDSPDERGIDVGLLYNPKYFKPIFSEPLFIDIKNEDGSPRYTRDILYVTGMYDGEQIHILVGHWPSRRGGEEASAPYREKAARVCKHKIDSITKLNADAKILVMGDLNDDPVSPSVAIVLKAKGEKEKVKKGSLYNPWMDYYMKGIGTLAYNDAWNLFDQILLTPAFISKNKTGYFFKEADIFSKPWMVQKTGRFKGYPLRTYDFNKYIGGYSDHFPTYVVLLKEIK